MGRELPGHERQVRNLATLVEHPQGPSPTFSHRRSSALVDPAVKTVLAEFEGNFGYTFFFLCLGKASEASLGEGEKVGFTSFEEISITKAMRGRWSALGREED